MKELVVPVNNAGVGGVGCTPILFAIQVHVCATGEGMVLNRVSQKLS